MFDFMPVLSINIKITLSMNSRNTQTRKHGNVQASKAVTYLVNPIVGAT